MQAIEFNTVIKNCWLKIPHHAPDWENQSVKVIVLLPLPFTWLMMMILMLRRRLKIGRYHCDFIGHPYLDMVDTGRSITQRGDELDG